MSTSLFRSLFLSGGGSVTNAGVAAAIAEDPDAVIEALNEATAALEVASIGLSDTTGLTLAANHLGVNASGELVVHDNIHPSGKMVSGFRRFRGEAFVAGATISAADSGVLVATIPLASSETAVGKVFKLQGEIIISTSGVVGSPVEVGILSNQGYLDYGIITPGSLVGYSKDAAKLLAKTSLNIGAIATGTTFDLHGSNCECIEISHSGAATTIGDVTLSVGYSDVWTPGAQNIYIAIVIGQTAVASSLEIRWDLEFSVQ